MLRIPVPAADAEEAEEVVAKPVPGGGLCRRSATSLDAALRVETKVRSNAKPVAVGAEIDEDEDEEAPGKGVRDGSAAASAPC